MLDDVVDGDDADLPLFTGMHVPRIRFERALDRLDLAAAAADAAEELRTDVEALRDAVGSSGGALAALRAVRRRDWPDLLERTWQRLVGRQLDAHGVPGTLDGDLAAAFLLRGGERERARASLGRHLRFHPKDERAWRLVAEFEPVRGAVRCAFHGGPVLDAAWELADQVAEDEAAPVADWLLSYAWCAGAITLDEVADALTAEGIRSAPPIPLPGDGRAFAWFLLDAGGRPLGPGSTGVVAARARLQRIHPTAYRRYLARATRVQPSTR